MKTYIIAAFWGTIFPLFYQSTLSQKQSEIKVEVQISKKNINTGKDLLIKIRLYNGSNKKIQIPTYPLFASIYQHIYDIGYEIIRDSSDLSVIKDTCEILAQRMYPPNGLLTETLEKNRSKYYRYLLPFPCFLQKGKYKVRFILKSKLFDKECRNVKSNWIEFYVTHELKPEDWK